MHRRTFAIFLQIIVSLGGCHDSRAAGAFAVGRTDSRSWGSGAANAASPDDAARQALARCVTHGAGCSIVKYFNRACFAIVATPGTGDYAWATRSTQSEAKEAALDRCLSSGRTCEFKVSLCDGPAAETRYAGQNIRGSTYKPDADTIIPVIFFLGLAAISIAAFYSLLKGRPAPQSRQPSADEYNADALILAARRHHTDMMTELRMAEIDAARINAIHQERNEIIAHDKTVRELKARLDEKRRSS